MLRNIKRPRFLRFLHMLPVLLLFSMTGSGITPTIAQDSTPDGLRGIAPPSVASDAPLVELPAAEGTELVKNGGFENAPATNKKNAKQWTWAGKRSGGDRRLCNTATNTTIAFNGQCAMQFSSGAGLPRSIYQKRTFSPALGAANDQLALSLVASTKNLSKNLSVKLKVKYKGGGNRTFNLQIPPVAGDQPYAPFSKQFKLGGAIQNFELRLASAAKGRVRIDSLSLIHLPETPPQFVSSIPADGEQDMALGTKTISMTFDEPVHVEVGWYDLNCVPNTGAISIGVSGDGTDTITLTSNKEFAVGDICEVDIYGDFISDADADDPPDTMIDDAFFSFHILDDPPQPMPDNYSVSPNIGLTVPAAAGYLVNDTLVRGVLISPAVGTPIPTTEGGTVTLLTDGSGKPTGAFTYEPPLGKRNITDRFSYTLQNAIGQTSAMVSLNLMPAPAVWFINAAAPQNGSGALSSPFIDIAAYNTVAGGGSTVRTGDIVFLYSGAYTGSGLILKNSQVVVGQGINLTTLMTWLPAHSNSLPGVSTRPVISTLLGAGVLLGQNNALSGFNIGDTANYAISGSMVGTLTISEVGVTTTNGALNVATGGPLDIQFDSVTAIGTAIAPAINLLNTSGTLYIEDGLLSGLNGDMFVVSGGTPTIIYEGDMTTVGNGWLLRVENTTGGEITLRNGTLGAVAHGVKATNAAHVRLRDLTLERINPIIDEFMRLLANRYGAVEGNFALDDIVNMNAFSADAPMVDEANGVQVENSQLTLRDMTVNDFAANGVSAANSVLTLINVDLLDNDLSALFISSQSGNTSLDMADSTVFTTTGAGVTMTAGENGVVCADLQNNTINGSGTGWGLWLETMAATAQIALRDYAGEINNAGQITTFIQAANGVTPSTNVLSTLGSIGSDPLCDSGG